MVTGGVCQSVDPLTIHDEEYAVIPRHLTSLFPTSVVVRERRAAGDPADLLPSEAVYVANAHPKRRLEFAAGRACARAALAALGAARCALPPAADRQPLWPDGFVGSITHTSGLCVAAVAARRDVMALGVDSEVVGAPTADIWPTLCREEELAWVGTLPASAQPAAVTLLFSAKEAFYKCQYPLMGEWLDFHDLRVEVADWGQPSGAFATFATRRLRFSDRVCLPLAGRYVFDGQFVSAGVWVGADAVPAQ